MHSYLSLLAVLMLAAFTATAQLNTIQLRTTGTNTTTLKAASSGGNMTLTLPSSAGSNGQVLTTDGSGTLSWTTAASAASTWSITGNGSTDSTLNFLGTTDGAPLIFKANNTERIRIASDGFIGIGTSSPVGAVHIEVAGTAAQRLIVGSVGGSVLSPLNLFNSNTTSASGSGMVFSAGDISTFIGGVSSQRIDAATNSRTAMRVLSNGSLTGTNTSAPFYLEGSTDGVIIVANGTMGVNTGSPGSALDVKGTLRLSGSTSGYVGVAPAAAAGSTTYTLPSADGTDGQVLATNGSGVLSWKTVAPAPTAPVTYTADATIGATDQWIIVNKGATDATMTLPNPATNTGRVLTFQTITTNGVNSSVSNVVIAGGVAGTTIITTGGTVGTWATLVSDGTNWVVMTSGAP